MNKSYSFTLFSSTPFSKLHSVKKLALCVLFGGVYLAGSLQAQVNVTSTGGTMMASYGTLSAAITAINAGTHTGTITVDVMAGHTETLSARIDLTATGTMANPITIQKSGAGANPKLTA